MTIPYTKILEADSSFGLVRTNPKLTGNIKLSVDSVGDMWLSAIPANKELSKEQYSKVSIDPNSTLSSSIYKFFNNGRTPNEIVFSLTETIDPTQTSKNFNDQYDFSNYFSGAKYLASKKYSERLSYFAPLYLKKDIPNYFVIFKINDPVNKPLDQLKAEYPYSTENYLKDLFEKATIIKTFDLSEDSKIGKYLRKYIGSPDFPASSLNVSYDKDRLTTWNGTLVDSGVLGSRGEDLYDFYQTAYPLKFSEEFTTLGFERNGVIFPNIINLEFAFDDDSSQNYEFSRYLGIYVNSIELTKLDIDLNRLFENRVNWTNTPVLKKEYFENNEAVVYQENLTGIEVPYKNKSIAFLEFADSFTNADNFFFTYLADKDNLLYLPKVVSPLQLDYDAFNNEVDTGVITLSNKSIDLGKFFGPDTDFLQDTGSGASARGNSSSYITVNSELAHLDSIQYYHPNGTRTDLDGKYDLFTATASYPLVPNPGDAYYYHDIDGSLGYDKFYFNSTGTPLQIATAISTCIKSVRTRAYSVFQHENTIIIKASSAGDKDSAFGFKFNSAVANSTSLSILDKTGIDILGVLLTFEGGTLNSAGRLIIESDHRSKILSNIDSILVRTKSGWSKIKKTSKYYDVITEKAFSKELTREAAFTKFSTSVVLTLESDDEPAISYKQFTMKLKFRPSFGLLSMLPIKDFDFDFYSSKYDNFPEIDLYATHYIPEKIMYLQPGIDYRIVGTGSIKLSNGSIISSSSPQPFTVPTEVTYETFVGTVIVSYYYSLTTGESVTVPISDLNGELSEFSGFSILKDQFLIQPNSDNEYFQLKTKYVNGATPTEYDYYKENETVDFALRSKILPYITKWAIEEGTDARGNAYRLNAETAFGYNNFSPDHVDTTQNPSNFTHEWFYIESSFNYNLSEETVKLNNYYFDHPLDETELLSDPNYFVNYFTYSPKIVGSTVEVGDTQFRYSKIFKNALGEYQTLFKGFRISLKDVINASVLQEDGRPIVDSQTDRFEDYKFSALLRVKKEAINDNLTPPITYRVIEHKDFKFILLLIEVSLGDLSDIDDYRKILQGNLVGGKDDGSLMPNDSNMYSIFPSSKYSYQTVNGDYRIQFSTIDGVEVSNLSHMYLYALKHKKYNSLFDSFSNIKLASKVNLNSPALNKLNNLNYLNYPFSLKEELPARKTNTTYLGVRFIVSGAEYVLDEYDIVGITPKFMSPLANSNANSIQLSPSSTSPYLIDPFSQTVFQSIPTAIGSSFFQNRAIFKIITGGELYYESLFAKLSFANFKKYVNDYSPFIEYSSYSMVSGSPTKANDPLFYAEVISPKEVVKINALVVQEDTDRPVQFSSSSSISTQKYEGQKLSTLPTNTVSPLIGYTYGRLKLNSPYNINRYDGGYEPIFKNIAKYTSTFQFKYNAIDSLEQSNTKLNVYSEYFYSLANFSHIKIADTKILTLESDDQYDPEYELIDEIAIGRADYFVLQSNWDYGFHYKYLTKRERLPVSGTLRIEEDTAFLSKLMQLPEIIELENYVISSIPFSTELKNVNQNNIELAIRETDYAISGLINLNNVLTSYLLSAGFAQQFEEFIPQTSEYLGNYSSLTNYIKAYISTNIHKLYDVETIEFYVKPSKSTVSSIDEVKNVNTIDFQFLTDAQRYQQGFTLSKDFKINKTGKLKLSYEFNKPIDTGLIISPKIKIKFI